MNILVDSISKIVINAGNIEKGFFQVDPSTELYKIDNKHGEFYTVAKGICVYDVEELPEQITCDGKYCYTEEKGFYNNPDWKPDENSEIETLKRENKVISAKLDYLAMMADIYLPD